MHYTPHQMAVTAFVEAVGVWIDELQVHQLLEAPLFSLMADECTDIAVLEELTFLCVCWMENGSPVEHFMEILPSKNADSIYSALIEWIEKKNIQCHKLVGKGLMVQQPL